MAEWSRKDFRRSQDSVQELSVSDCFPFWNTERQKEEEIVAKEKSAAELRRKYFGPEGELYKKRESLMQPIQDEIYNAVKEIATQNGYAVVVDRASASSIILPRRVLTSAMKYLQTGIFKLISYICFRI